MVPEDVEAAVCVAGVALLFWAQQRVQGCLEVGATLGIEAAVVT